MFVFNGNMCYTISRGYGADLNRAHRVQEVIDIEEIRDRAQIPDRNTSGT